MIKDKETLIHWEAEPSVNSKPSIRVDYNYSISIRVRHAGNPFCRIAVLTIVRVADKIAIAPNGIPLAMCRYLKLNVTPRKLLR